MGGATAVTQQQVQRGRTGVDGVVTTAGGCVISGCRRGRLLRWVSFQRGCNEERSSWGFTSSKLYRVVIKARRGTRDAFKDFVVIAGGEG